MRVRVRTLVHVCGFMGVAVRGSIKDTCTQSWVQGIES